jgi:hypothetical protein
MKINQIGTNMTELDFSNTNTPQRSVMFSYDTPVAGWDEQGAFRTDFEFGGTTTKHINKYLGKGIGRIVSQSWIESLLDD